MNVFAILIFIGLLAFAVLQIVKIIKIIKEKNKQSL